MTYPPHLLPTLHPIFQELVQRPEWLLNCEEDPDNWIHLVQYACYRTDGSSTVLHDVYQKSDLPLAETPIDIPKVGERLELPGGYPVEIIEVESSRSFDENVDPPVWRQYSCAMVKPVEPPTHAVVIGYNFESPDSPPSYGSTMQHDPTKYPFVAPKPEELQAYIDQAITTTPVDPRTIVLYDGFTYPIENLPSPKLRAMFGYGHYSRSDRPVIERTDGKPWPYTPKTCRLADNPKGVWVDPQHLACPGCGRDGT